MLRFIQDREFKRLGSNRTRTVDARIIAAANINLIDALRNGGFREDLFYRLNVFPIMVPPLKDKREDIPSLIDFFSRKMCREYVRDLQFTPAATDALSRYHWPGNVREMENLLERLARIRRGKIIDLDNLSPYISLTHPGLRNTNCPGLDSLIETEKRTVVSALERHNWVQSCAARELGITLRQMGYKIRKFGLNDLVKRMKYSA